MKSFAIILRILVWRGGSCRIIVWATIGVSEPGAPWNGKPSVSGFELNRVSERIALTSSYFGEEHDVVLTAD